MFQPLGDGVVNPAASAAQLGVDPPLGSIEPTSGLVGPAELVVGHCEDERVQYGDFVAAWLVFDAVLEHGDGIGKAAGAVKPQPDDVVGPGLILLLDWRRSASRRASFASACGPDARTQACAVISSHPGS